MAEYQRKSGVRTTCNKPHPAHQPQYKATICINASRVINPPYKGSKGQSSEQKTDFPHVFGERKYAKDLDYVALWFVKGADYIRGTRAQLAFVSTNSVAQGQHVSFMFPTVLAGGIEIGYAYTSFKWDNNAKHNAGVAVVVISLRNKSAAPKYIFAGERRTEAENINGYLVDAPDIYIEKRKPALSNGFLPMVFGNMPRDGGNLVLNDSERSGFIEQDQRCDSFIKKYIGADDYINGHSRYCIWVDEESKHEAYKIDVLRSRFEYVARFRERSAAGSTAKYAEKPYRFVQISYKPTDAIILPSVSSERREYIPIGYLGPDTVISNAAFAVYDAEPWLFALLTSKMHIVWTAAVGGRLESRLRYSNTIVYNNFPVPELSEKTKQELTKCALRVLDVREYHSEYTLAELYDPQKMPDNLRLAHQQIDELVDSIYSAKPFESDEARLALLFQLYVEMSTAADAAAAKKTTLTRSKKITS